MDDVAALSEALREIDEGRAISTTWLRARCPDRGDDVAEALLLESMLASGAEVPPRVGPYRVVRELGRGGMGVVYLAETDARERRTAGAGRVAVKVLHARLAARPEAIQAILREAALGREGSHPHVVPVIDAGTCMVAGRSSIYVAMPFIDGSPLSRRLRVEGPLSERDCMGVARDVAGALVALHGRGILHRDVKPSNILVSDSGAALLADLGVAMLRSELACATDRPMFAGTLPYAAPEQVAGAEIDGRADLYALGVTLHELATGVACDSLRRVSLRGHSRYFEELVRKLLAPRRDARFDSSAALLEALDGGEQSRWWTRRAAALRAGGGSSVTRHRRGPRLHGREGELAQLLAALEDAKAGEGCAVLVTGEAGIGKSRLLEEFLREIARRDEALRVWHCAFPLVRDPQALLPLERSARDILARAELPPETLASPVAAAYVSMAESLSADLPLVAIFDDLQLASADEKATVVALATVAPGRAMLVLGTSRGPPALALPQGSERIAMRRLGVDATQRVVRDAVGQASPDLVNRIAARSGGNPFFARALSRMPSAARRPATRLPAAIRRLVRERLARLGGGDRELLDVCACYGSRIDPPVVAGALRIAVPDVLGRLASIAAESDLLVRGSAGFAFDHHLIVEALVRGIPAGRRRGYYAALAVALEASVPVPIPGDTAVALCRLYLDGNRAVDALRHLDRALDALTSAHARADAAQLCDRVLAVPGLVEGARRLGLLVRAEEIGQSLGRDTSLLLDEALANATERGDAAARARILVQSARRLYAKGHNDRALALLDEAERTAPDPHVDLVRGQVFHTLGRPDQACARLEQAIRRGRANGDARLEVRAMGVLSSILVNRGRFSEARAAAEATLALSKAAHDLEGEVIALHGLINVLLQAEEYARAEEVIRQQLELVRRLSDRRSEGRARRGLACCLQMQGDLVGARREFERARALAEAIGDLLNEAQATGDLGALRFREGRLSDALTLSERAISLSERTAQPVGQSVGHYMAGGACVFLGMPEMARSRFEAALAVSRRHGIRFGEAYALQGLADVHAFRSTGDEVLARYEEALAVRREAAPDTASSELLLPIANLFLRRDEPERARPYVERVLGAGDIGSRILAAAYFAVLPGVDVRRAVDSIMELDPRAPVLERMTARFLAWRVTGEISHLAEAYRLVLHVREHAPPDARDVMLVRVPLYAAIVAAWKEGTLTGRGIYGEP